MQQVSLSEMFVYLLFGAFGLSLKGRFPEPQHDPTIGKSELEKKKFSKFYNIWGVYLASCFTHDAHLNYSNIHSA